MEKQLLTYGNIQLAIAIFFLYYGVAILTIESGPPIANSLEFEDARSLFFRTFFPVSWGMGFRISKLGIEHAESSAGALLVLWSAQVTVGMLMDAVDASFAYQ